MWPWEPHILAGRLVGNKSRSPQCLLHLLPTTCPWLNHFPFLSLHFHIWKMRQRILHITGLLEAIDETMYERSFIKQKAFPRGWRSSCRDAMPRPLQRSIPASPPHTLFFSSLKVTVLPRGQKIERSHLHLCPVKRLPVFFSPCH